MKIHPESNLFASAQSTLHSRSTIDDLEEATGGVQRLNRAGVLFW